jgi:hypothetical protein
MALYLRKVIHPQAHDNTASSSSVRAIMSRPGRLEIQDGAVWRWGIDTVIPMRVMETQGKKDRRDCMWQFRAAWDCFAAERRMQS